MKKLFLASAVVASLCFVGCSDDDDASSPSDCFTCEALMSEICYTEGDDFYTVTVANQVSQEVPLDGETWEDVKADYEEYCAE